MAKSQVIIGVRGDVNLTDIDKGIAKLEKLRAEANNGSPAFKVLGENVDGFSKTISGNFTEALTGVGAAIAGAFAVEKVGEFFKSTIEAAMEDEKALRSLAITMRNVGDSTPIKEVTEFVDKLAEQTGVAKEQLIPAYQRLLTVTGDAEKSQNSLKLAMDISAGTGRDLETVTLALSRGFAGSTTALSRLGAGIDKSVLATGDMTQITQVLADKFQGQAAAAADTFSGRLNRISVATNQAKEDIGYALLNSIDQLSQAFGGAGGITAQIDAFGKSVANTINGVNFLTRSISGLAQSVSGGAGATETWIDKLRSMTDYVANKAVPGLEMYRNILQVLGLLGAQDAAKTQQQADEFQGYSAAIAAYDKTARASVNGGYALADSVSAAGDAATTAADDMLKMAYATSVVLSGGRSTKATYSGLGTPTAGYDEKYFTDSITATISAYKALQDAAGKASGGGGRAAKQAGDTIKLVAIDYAKASADISKTLGSLSVSISGGGEKVTQALADEFKARTDTFTGVVKEQLGVIKSAQDAIASYSDSISSSILGQLSFKTAAKDAEGNDVNLSPDAIAKLMLGDIANQSKAVGKIAGIALKLPDALTKQILALPSDAAIALADYLSANPDMTQRLTENYQALAEQTKTLLGDPMAQAFATVGGESAVALIAGAREAIAAASSEFQAWASNALHVTITMDTSNVAPTAVTAANSALDAALAAIAPTRETLAAAGGFMGLLNPLAGRATGGTVTGGTPYIVGENGPEVFVPGIDGTIIPNGGMAGGSSGSGNQYAITVNSGVGDPRQIGQDIVQYIRLFEQSSGRVFAKA